MNSVLIEEMTADDYDEAYSLWEKCEGIELTSADTRASIVRFLERNPGLSFVARDPDRSLVGVVLCGHDGRRGYIDHLAVDPAYRYQGIGKALVSRCLFHLTKIGIRKWHLFVQQDNQPAISFWRKLGWAPRIELVTMSHYTPDPVHLPEK